MTTLNGTRTSKQAEGINVIVKVHANHMRVQSTAPVIKVKEKEMKIY